MTPKTRKRKSRLAKDFVDFIQNLGLMSKHDEIDVLILSLKKLSVRKAPFKLCAN